MTGLHDDALRVLEDWVPPDGEQERHRAAYAAFLRTHPRGVWRDGGPAHLTASALVLDDAGERTLLTHHRKGDFWAQLGGHCERGDTSLADAAVREATEESGISGLRLVGAGPVDLNRHVLSAAFDPCREHWDVRYALVAPADAQHVVSEESHALRWFPVDALPDGLADITTLVRAAVAAVRAQSSDSPSSAVAETPSR